MASARSRMSTGTAFDTYQNGGCQQVQAQFDMEKCAVLQPCAKQRQHFILIDSHYRAAPFGDDTSIQSYPLHVETAITAQRRGAKTGRRERSRGTHERIFVAINIMNAAFMVHSRCLHGAFMMHSFFQ